MISRHTGQSCSGSRPSNDRLNSALTCLSSGRDKLNCVCVWRVCVGVCECVCVGVWTYPVITSGYGTCLYLVSSPRLDHRLYHLYTSHISHTHTQYTPWPHTHTIHTHTQPLYTPYDNLPRTLAVKNLRNLSNSLFS